MLDTDLRGLEMKDVLIVGASGLAKEVIAWCSSVFNVVGYTTPSNFSDNQFDLPGSSFSDDEVTPDVAGTEHVLFAIGSTKIRRKLHLIYQEKGFKFPNLIHPSSVVSTSACLGEGVIIAPNCVVSADVKIGNLCFINFQCGIGHDATIGNYVQINPGSQLGGCCIVCDETLIGSSSTILQGVKVGSSVTVGSGSVVFAKVANGSTVMGNPARRMRSFER